MHTYTEQTQTEEVVNTLTHGVGIALGCAGTAVMIVFAAIYGTAWHVVGVSIYGTTLILMFLASTAYHGARSPRIKHIFNVLDHAAIYLLIAGTYTPFTLVTLHGKTGWWLFGIIWGLALCGVVYKTLSIKALSRLSPLLYILMGWIVIFAVKPLVAALPLPGLILLFAGGVSYTAGVIFYVWRSLPFNHGIWHCFVLGGGVLQYLSVVFFVVPAPLG